jgi:PTH2 family peptidyl-tRNA hydrolase
MDEGTLVQYYLAERGRLGDGALGLLAARAALLGHARWRTRPAYARWHARVMTKVVLGATAAELTALAGVLGHLRLAPKTRGPAPEPAGRPALVLVAAGDLGMHGGKLAAQCAHAALLAQAAYGRHPGWAAWVAAGRPMALRRATSAELAALAEDFPGGAVHDAGHTQVPAGALTVVAVPPWAWAGAAARLLDEGAAW